MKRNENFVKAFEESSVVTISNNVLEIYFHLVGLYKNYGFSKNDAIKKAEEIVEKAFEEWKQKRYGYKGETFISNKFAM